MVIVRGLLFFSFFFLFLFYFRLYRRISFGSFRACIGYGCIAWDVYWERWVVQWGLICNTVKTFLYSDGTFVCEASFCVGLADLFSLL